MVFQGKDIYTYKIKENSKGDWVFRASYDLKYIGERIFSEEQKVNIQLDKVLPSIKVKQNKSGWTNQDVVFSLSNEADNISGISYYVKMKKTGNVLKEISILFRRTNRVININLRLYQK